MSISLPSAAPLPRRVVAISPHLDDGALSVGGTLAMYAAMGTEVFLATVFTGGPDDGLSAAARKFHRMCGLGDDAIRLRVEEDHRACRSLGVEPRHLGLPEALYRVTLTGAPSITELSQLFDDGVLVDPIVVRAVQLRLEGLLAEIRPDLLLLPLGVGRHLDHVTVREAALRCPPVCTSLRFEEMPYALDDQPSTRGSHQLTEGLLPRLIAVSEAAWNAKIEAIGHYSSQMGTLWREGPPWTVQMRDHALHAGGGRLAERMWGTAPR